MKTGLNLCLCLALLLAPHSLYADNSLVKVGVLAYRGIDKAQARWTPTIDYLQANIQDHTFVLVPLGLQEMYAAVVNDELDFVFTNTGHYYSMKQFGLQPFVSLINLRMDKPYDKFGAVIFTHKDRADINKLEDLKGKTFAAVDKMAFGGFQMAWLEMVENDIDPFVELTVKFAGFPQDEIVKMVLDKKVDAGTVRTDTLESMHKEGSIDLDTLKILNQKKVENFPFKLSTRLYPEWPFCATKNTPETLTDKVKYHLLTLTRDSVPAQKGKYAGWTNQGGFEYLFMASLEQLSNIDLSIKPPPKDKYQSVDKLMEKLKIGPYTKQQ